MLFWYGFVDYQDILSKQAGLVYSHRMCLPAQSGIINALPHLEESLAKLRNLEIPAAEKDIIDSVRVAVNTPFMQVIKCKERQRELQAQLQPNPDQVVEVAKKTCVQKL